jgi:hypothetical protein
MLFITDSNENELKTFVKYSKSKCQIYSIFEKMFASKKKFRKSLLSKNSQTLNKKLLSRLDKL